MVGVAITLPTVLFYTEYSYYVFRGTVLRPLRYGEKVARDAPQVVLAMLAECRQRC